MPTPHTVQLLQAVARRLRLVAILQGFLFWLFVFGGAFGLLLIANRLLGLGQGVATWQTWLLVPLLSLLTAALWHRRHSVLDAARRIDEQCQTKDLFLTWADLNHTTGAYQPVVAAQAESEAQRIKPDVVVPLEPDRRGAYAAALLAGLLLGVLLLPQWDPFGRVAAADSMKNLQKQLELERKATQTRISQVKQELSEEAEQTKAEQDIDELKQALRQMKPQEKQPNLERLNRHQGELGAQWRQLGAEKLKNLMSQSTSLQDFGGQRTQKMEKWTEALKNGDTKLMHAELNDLMDLAREIAEEKDPEKRAELAREMKERLKDLERFASERAGSPEARAAIQRAMRQMEAAEKAGQDVTPEMLKDLAESLELSKMELQKMANAAKDMKKLEEALKTLQMAKQLNEGEKLDGEACEGCQTLEDYAELYAKMMQQEGNGEGMGGPGMGEGGKAEENDALQTNTKEEKTKIALQAGKTLMTMKTRGLGEEGDVRKEYREQFDRVKQSVSEAILQEQIPPGYHESIRGYFDSIEAAPPAVTDSP